MATPVAPITDSHSLTRLEEHDDGERVSHEPECAHQRQRQALHVEAEQVFLGLRNRHRRPVGVGQPGGGGGLVLLLCIRREKALIS